MRKALVPLLASLALCGAATAALVATNARAQSSFIPSSQPSSAARRPVMMAMAATPLTTPLSAMTASAPGDDGGAPPDMAGPPGQFCKDMVARRIGELAYFEAKLSLTAAQKPAFDRWKDATLEVARRQAAHCGDRPHEKERPTLIGHMEREEVLLKERLADLETERPALEGLYTALNPQQQMELTRGLRTLLMMRGMMMEHGPMGGHHMMMGMAGHPHGPEMGPPPPDGRGPDAPPPQ